MRAALRVRKSLISTSRASCSSYPFGNLSMIGWPKPTACRSPKVSFLAACWPHGTILPIIAPRSQDRQTKEMCWQPRPPPQAARRCIQHQNGSACSYATKSVVLSEAAPILISRSWGWLEMLPHVTCDAMATSVRGFVPSKPCQQKQSQASCR